MEHRALAIKLKCLNLLGITLTTISGIIIAIWVIDEAYYGMCFQDESFALLVAKDPNAYQLLPTRIGYFLRPFVLACSNDIPSLRVVSYLLLATSLFLNFVYGRRMSTGLDPCFGDRVCFFSLALVVASFSWIARSGTCRSLCYNQQTAILLLLLSACLLAWLSNNKKEQSPISWSWSHFFSGFLFTWLGMIKPSAALIFLVVAGLALLYLGYFKSWQESRCALLGACLLLLPYFILCESPATLIANLKEWQVQEALLQSGHGLGAATSFAYQQTLAIYGESLSFFGTRFMVCLLVFSCSLWFFHKRIPHSVAAIFGMLLLPLAATAGNLHAFSIAFIHSCSGGFALAIAIACSAFVTTVFYKGLSHWKKPHLIWCYFLCFLAPLLYSFGSEVVFQSRAGGAASIYLGMALLLVDAGVARQGRSPKWIPVASALLLSFYLYPNWKDSSVPPKETLAWGLGGLPYLDDLDPAEFSSFLKKAEEGGWNSDTEVLDFWGRYPGITYLMGGKSPVWPWYMSTYSGAEKFTAYNLTSLTPERLARLWIIEAEPAQPHVQLAKMPLPRNFAEGYLKVGQFRFRENVNQPWTDV
ncbi:MAG: hypothetical protein VW879_08930, partial [Opitutae bacterium]